MSATAGKAVYYKRAHVGAVWREATENSNAFFFIFYALPLQNLSFGIFVGFKTDKIVDFYNFVGFKTDKIVDFIFFVRP